MHFPKVSIRGVTAGAVGIVLLTNLAVSTFWPELHLGQIIMINVLLAACLSFQVLTLLWMGNRISADQSRPVPFVSAPPDLPSPRERFLVKQGQKLLSLEIGDIAWFHAEDKLCYLKTWDNHRHFLEYTLEELHEILPAKSFFRINRAYIVHFKAIKSINPFFNGKLILQLQPDTEEHEVLVSKERAVPFKHWLGK